MGIRRSFTLIETIVVIAVIGLVLPTIFAIIFTVLQQQNKVYRMTTIKREGDYTLNIISNLIRNNARHIYSSISPDIEVCQQIESTSPSENLFFRDKDNQWFGFAFSYNKISSSSAALTTDLNSSKTIVSNFSISCQKTADYSSPTVSLSFDICFNNESGSCMHYQTKIKLRNF